MVVYKANKDLNYLVELFEAENLRPVIDKCFPLDKAVEAFRYFGEGCFKGKIVVTCC
jgi:NADPH:quinone reductase-like Zn-dependent oxidoreductase